ncbi:hypothetical protein EG329_008828 [Mollisiaceae sp. DMI_Dod_QoI]|nr:hypothetical protein EG329_008828 [Helotiales sp. DMI_Dod_QoI]
MSDQDSENSTSQSGSDAVQRGGAGMDKTPANPDGGGSSNNTENTQQGFEPEPDFMKRKPGNAPGIASQLREK